MSESQIKNSQLAGGITADKLAGGVAPPQSYYRGAVTQTLGAIGATAGTWRHFKAWGVGGLIINGPANTMIPPGAASVTPPVSTYTSPDGETTSWFNDGTYWVFQ